MTTSSGELHVLQTVDGSRVCYRRWLPDGDVRDMRSFWIMGYFDPDGAAHEVMLPRPAFAASDMLERVEWTTVTLDGV